MSRYNITQENFLQALPSIGFTMTTNRAEIIPGSVIIVGKMVNGQPDNTYHTFAVTAYDPATGLCDKYDMGSNQSLMNGGFLYE